MGHYDLSKSGCHTTKFTIGGSCHMTEEGFKLDLAKNRLMADNDILIAVILSI